MITTCITDTAAHTWEQHACSSVYNRKLMITTAQPTLPPTPGSSAHVQASALASSVANCWAEAPIKIARMTLTIKLDGNWSSFQLANSTPPLSVTDSAIAPSARMVVRSCLSRPLKQNMQPYKLFDACTQFDICSDIVAQQGFITSDPMVRRRPHQALCSKEDIITDE